MTRNHLFIFAPFALLGSLSALAQQPPAVTTAQGPPGGGPKVIAHNRNHNETHNVQYRVSPDGGPGMRPDLRIVPPGLWWKSPDIIQKLSLTSDQQKRMDDIFQQSRLQLIDLKANVEKQEVILEPMLSANPPDTNKVLSQIDHVASARAELEKANARMLLGIRGVLSADQWTKLQAEERENHRLMMFKTPGGPAVTLPGPMRFKGPEGPGGPDGFGFGPGAGLKGPDIRGFKILGGSSLSQLNLPQLPDTFSVESGNTIGGFAIGAPDVEVQPLILNEDDDIDF